MPEKISPDLTCVPYRHRGRYYALTIPFSLLLLVVMVYLGSFHIGLAFTFLAFYLVMVYFQAYCCAYQSCPYIGAFCPAIAGILPANYLAKRLFPKGVVNPSKTRFEVQAILAILGWLGLAFFPFYWIARLGTLYAVVYVLAHLVYYFIFALTICPACAIRTTCPGGMLHSILNRR